MAVQEWYPYQSAPLAAACSQRSCPALRVRDVSIVETWQGWPGLASIVAPNPPSWVAVGVVLALLALMGTVRLLVEWQRRITLIAVLRQAPGGSVVIQQRGLGGPPMRVWVGGGPWPQTTNR